MKESKSLASSYFSFYGGGLSRIIRLTRLPFQSINFSWERTVLTACSVLNRTE